MKLVLSIVARTLGYFAFASALHDEQIVLSDHGAGATGALNVAIIGSFHQLDTRLAMVLNYCRCWSSRRIVGLPRKEVRHRRRLPSQHYRFRAELVHRRPFNNRLRIR